MALKPKEIGEGKLKLTPIEEEIANDIEEEIDEKLKIAEKSKSEYRITIFRDSLPDIVKREIERRYKDAGWSNAGMETDPRYQGDYGETSHTLILR